MKQKYKVKLTPKQRLQLLELVNTGEGKAKKLLHARILLLVDSSKAGLAKKAREVAEILNISDRTIHRVRNKFAEYGLETALNRKPHKAHKPKRLDGEQEARLVAICCSKAPEGRISWTLELLSKELVKLKIVDSISKSTIHRVLKKTKLNRG